MGACAQSDARRSHFAVRLTAIVRRRNACNLMNPAASFWSYTPPSSSKLLILSSYRLYGDLRPTRMTLPCSAHFHLKQKSHERHTQRHATCNFAPPHIVHIVLCCGSALPRETYNLQSAQERDLGYFIVSRRKRNRPTVCLQLCWK